MAEENTTTEETGLDMESASNEVWDGLGIQGENPNERETEVETETQTEQAAPVVTEQPVVRAAPKSWAKETHEHWAKMPKEAQDQVEHREKQMLDGLEQYKGDAGFGKSLREVMTPYKALLDSQGVDEPKAVQYLLSSHYKLSTGDASQKAEYFATLAKHYGIDVGALGTPTQEDPAVKALREQVETLQTGLTAREQASLNEAKARVSKDVEAFASDKAHPYFNEVSEEMLPFLRAGMELGEAYEKAVWANEVTRTKEMARIQTETETKLKENARLDALKARKASSTNVRSRDTNRAPTEPLGTMEDTMKATLKEIKERVH